MDVLGDCLAGGDAATLAYEWPGTRAKCCQYGTLQTNAWKAGNLFRHYGVREGATVGVVDAGDRTPTLDTLVAVFGAAVLGATVRLGPPSDADVRVLVAPTDRVAEFDLTPGSTAMGYGSDPEDPTVKNFGRERWSENPIQFPADIDPEDTALSTAAAEYSHNQLLDTAEAVCAEFDLAAGDRVTLDGTVSEPGAFVAGVLAPLSVGATITVGADADLVVSDERSGENVVDPAAWVPE